jgi:hypothetical protein
MRTMTRGIRTLDGHIYRFVRVRPVIRSKLLLRERVILRRLQIVAWGLHDRAHSTSSCGCSGGCGSVTAVLFSYRCGRGLIWICCEGATSEKDDDEGKGKCESEPVECCVAEGQQWASV